MRARILSIYLPHRIADVELPPLSFTRIMLSVRSQFVLHVAIAREIRRLGRQALVLLADCEEDSAAEGLVEECWKWRDGIDIWINNAGADILTGDARIRDFDEKLARFWQIDVRATVQVWRRV